MKELQATPNRYRDKVALITGVSDRGIGAAIAMRLSSEGAAVSMLSLKKPVEVLANLEKRGHPALWTHCDLGRQDDIDRVMKASLERFGHIDVLINNAGVESLSPLEKLSDEEWQEVIDVNLTGLMRVTRACLFNLSERKGVIVNISSSCGLGATAGMVAYSASKAGVDGLTRSLALELAPKHIRVVAVAPAVVITPMTVRYAGELTNDKAQQLKIAHPLGFGSTQDVAASVAFLASDEARWISGITLPLGWMPTYCLPVFS